MVWNRLILGQAGGSVDTVVLPSGFIWTKYNPNLPDLSWTRTTITGTALICGHTKWRKCHSANYWRRYTGGKTTDGTVLGNRLTPPNSQAKDVELIVRRYITTSPAG